MGIYNKLTVKVFSLVLIIFLYKIKGGFIKFENRDLVGTKVETSHT